MNSQIPTKSNEEYILSTYYIKDLKYLNPNNDIKSVKMMENYVANEKKRKGVGCAVLCRLWLIEVLKGLREFMYEGTLHGVKYIFKPSFTRTERATWIIIVLISIACCFGNIIQLVSQWTSTPFVNVLDSLPTPVWAVPFPTVVLCPRLHVQLSFANVSELDSMQQFFASLICPEIVDEHRYLKNRLKNHQNKLLQDFIVQSSPKCVDIVKKCYWRTINKPDAWEPRECCDKLFQPVYTNYGLCFAFNTLPLNGMNNDTLLWHQSFNENAKAKDIEWELDTGYPKVFPPNLSIPPLRVMASGELHGLGLELFYNLSERQSACDGNSLGFQMFVNGPMDHVYTSTVLRLPMDRTTTVEVSPMKYATDVTLTTLPAEKRLCYFQGEKKLKYFKYYTDSNCKQDLLMTEVRKQCHCVMFNWPRKDIWEAICVTKSDYNCIDQVQDQVEKHLINAYYADTMDSFLSDVTPRASSCQPSCNDILYSSQVFYSNWDTLPKMGEITRVNVHFYDDVLLGRHRHVQYDDYYFVGAIGGLLSMFLGFSIISVAELVYFVIYRPFLVTMKEMYLWFRRF